MATCAQAWLCGWISLSGAISRALARTGRSGVGAKRRGSSGASRARLELVEGRLEGMAGFLQTLTEYRNPAGLLASRIQPMTTLTLPEAGLRQEATLIGLVGLAHGASHFSQLLLAPLFPWLKEALRSVTQSWAFSLPSSSWSRAWCRHCLDSGWIVMVRARC